MKSMTRQNWLMATALPLLNLITAFLVAGIVIAILGESPLETLMILVRAAFFNAEGLGYTLFYATGFIFTALAVAIPLQAGLFNIGGEGQMYLGGLGLTWVVLAFDPHLPAIVLIPLALLGSALFGAVWAWVPGYLQARRGSHVVVTTIMFNFIAASLMNFIVVTYLIPAGQQNTASRLFAESAWLPKLNVLLPQLGENPLNISFLLALAALALYGWMLNAHRLGYSLKVVGQNPHAAHYAGIPTGKMLILSMLLGGLCAGLAASNSLLGSQHYLNLNFPAGAGFIGIAVALMGRANPIGMALAALLFGGLIQGGFDLSLEKPNIPPETFVFIQGLIILFCGALENLYAPMFRRFFRVQEA